MALLLGRTTRIRRRRAEDVAETTDSLRAVACIRFVRRRWLHGLSVAQEKWIAKEECEADPGNYADSTSRNREVAGHAGLLV